MWVAIQMKISREAIKFNRNKNISTAGIINGLLKEDLEFVISHDKTPVTTSKTFPNYLLAFKTNLSLYFWVPVILRILVSFSSIVLKMSPLSEGDQQNIR